MRRGWRLLAALGLTAWAGVAAAAPPAPLRVASLNLASDEVLVEILPLERLVAVTSLADERGTSNIVGRVPARVARFPKADVERLVALAPDLVVVSEYTDADVLRLIGSSGIRAHRMTGLRSFAGYRAAILDLGRVVGALPAAEALVGRYDATLERLQAQLTGVRRPRVLYWADGMTAGSDTAIGALIAAAGGTNAAAASGLAGIAPIGAERAFALDPDIVLIGVWPGTLESLRGHPLLSQMRSVKSGRIVEMPTEMLVALSHHAVTACWDLAHRLHPDRVKTPRP